MAWRVEPDSPPGGRGSLYVQGTLHLGTDELYPLDERTIAAMEASDIVLAELSPGEMEKVQGLVLSRMAVSALPGGATVGAMLSPEEAAWARSLMGPDIFAALEPFEPWVMYSALDQYAAAAAGLDPGLGVDAALLAEAARLGVEVQGLETAEFQLRLLTGSPVADQLVLLRDSIREYRDRPGSLAWVYEAYRDDDRAALAAAVRGSAERSEAFDPSLGAFNDSLFASRNADWARRLAAMLDDGLAVYLFAGAGHFVGEGNVIELLEPYGYRVRP